MDDQASREDEILNNLEELIEEVIARELQHKMLVMLGPHCIIYHHDTICFIEKYSSYEHNQSGSIIYVSDGICFIPMSFPQDILFT